MNNVVEVRNIKIGDGIPKICVPIIGHTKDDIIDSARTIKNVCHDLIEWRVDWLDNPFDFQYVGSILKDLREILEDTPLLFTFRTSVEGGETEIDRETYYKLNLYAITTGFIDLIDAELFMGDEFVTNIIEEAHQNNVKVVVSNHDFERTPAKKELVGRLQRMQNLGADIPKLAVMPTDKTDVLTLLGATEEMVSTYATTPIVTMSMGKLGVLSRTCGEYFGSAITFGSAGEASAPGQIPAGTLNTILKKMHELF